MSKLEIYAKITVAQTCNWLNAVAGSQCSRFLFKPLHKTEKVVCTSTEHFVEGMYLLFCPPRPLIRKIRKIVFSFGDDFLLLTHVT